MADSSIGFGHNPFGDHQFGVGDWAEEILWRNMPEFYHECDESGPPGSVFEFPLRHFIDSVKPLLQELRNKWGQFPDLWDANTVPLAQLPQLGYNVGITVDPTKPEGLQRSSVLNASQLWITKGTDRGYRITAAFEGLLVVITPLWAESCAPASQLLGLAGSTPVSIDLATAPEIFHPVGPGTVLIELTTSRGVDETIVDENGLLVGAGNPANGPLTRLNIGSVVTLVLTSVVGTFAVGNTVTQGPNTGVIIAATGATIRLNVTVGTFGPGPVLNTTTLATATALTVVTNALTVGETITGLTSGTTAVVRENANSYLVVDKLTTLAGFSSGETILGQTSGDYGVAGAQTALVPGPLRFRLNLTGIAGSFATNQQITGGTSGAIGVIREVGGTFLYVDTITEPGFSIAEVVTGPSGSGTISAISTGTINYLTGVMTGHTVTIAPNTRVNLVVRLTTTPPSQFIPQYDVIPGDIISLDDVQSDKYAKWPKRYLPVRIRNGILTLGECRSYSLRLHFFTADNTEIENFLDVANRIILALEQFRPIHVRFDRISFDGASAASQVWYTDRIVAEASAASVWTVNVVADQQASSQVWTMSSLSATAAS